MKFSVLVPVYNVEKYLDACVRSVLNQTFQDFELILVNDGSTDGSGEICDFYAEKYGKVYTYHKTNSGPLHTRVYAIGRAKGDYIVFLDSDDQLKVEALETMYRTICRTKCDCVIYGFERVWNEKSLNQVTEKEEICIVDKRELYRKCFFSEQYNSLCRKAVKRTVFLNTDYSEYYHLDCAEDLLQSIEILKNSSKVVFITDILYKYTFNPKSITNSISPKNFKVDFSIYEKLVDFLKRENVWTEDDFREFRGHHLRMYCGVVNTVCRFNLKYSEIKKLLDILRSTDYYRKNLRGEQFDVEPLRYHKIVLVLFESKCDTVLLYLVRLYFHLYKLLHHTK